MSLVDADGQPFTLSLPQLITRCQEETTRFFKTQLSDSRFCFEIFRRALVEKSQDAWTALYQQYQPIVLHWLQRNSQLTHCDEDADALVNVTFAKFSSAVPAEKFNSFPGLKPLLNYLKLCAGSVMLDCLRKPRVETEEENAKVPESSDSGEEKVQKRELFEQINKRLKDDDERLVFYSLFTLGMKQREICEEWSHRFPSVQRVNQIRQNIVDRLKRDDDLGRYYTDSE